MLLYPTLSRGELETKIETDLVDIGQALIGDEAEDLQDAVNRDPVWFGGLFPHLGVDVKESNGTGSAQDRGDRPSMIEVHILIFYPCLPVRGLRSRDEDKISEAKRITRAIRDQFIAKLMQHPRLAPAVRIRQSRGASATEYGTSRTEETESEILWVDRSIIEFSV